LLIEAEARSEITLDASKSYGPDGDELSFNCYQYKEPTTAQSHIHCAVAPDVEFNHVALEGNQSRSIANVTLLPPDTSAVNIFTGQALNKGQALHFILEVKDNGSPSLATYKRVVVQVTNRDLRGGKRKSIIPSPRHLGILLSKH
jgi:hypothetical protein